MTLPDYEKLYQRYSGNGKLTVEILVKWLNEKSSCTPEIISLALRNLFTELAHGKTFPLNGCGDECDCSHELKSPYTAINHYVMRMAKAYQQQANREYWKVIEYVDHERIIKHLKILKQPGKIGKFFAYIFNTSENFKPYRKNFIEDK